MFQNCSNYVFVCMDIQVVIITYNTRKYIFVIVIRNKYSTSRCSIINEFMKSAFFKIDSLLKTVGTGKTCITEGKNTYILYLSVNK